MEKPAATKSKNKIMKFLPKAVSFQNIPFSPRRDLRADVNSHRVKALQNKGFSGPMIPAEARRKSKNFETQEPTSPKVSCMGQIKHKSKSSKISKQKHVSLPKEFKPAETGKIRAAAAVPAAEMAKKKKKELGIKKLFGAGRKSDASIDYKRPPISETAPNLNQMRKFASSRDAFANFDWTTAQIAPEEEEDRGFFSDDSDDDVIIPFSAPILMAGAGGGVSGLDLEPRKEINLWKRRTMAQPKPLHLDSE